MSDLHRYYYDLALQSSDYLKACLLYKVNRDRPEILAIYFEMIRKEYKSLLVDDSTVNLWDFREQLSQIPEIKNLMRNIDEITAYRDDQDYEAQVKYIYLKPVDLVLSHYDLYHLHYDMLPHVRIVECRRCNAKIKRYYENPVTSELQHLEPYHCNCGLILTVHGATLGIKQGDKP